MDGEHILISVPPHWGGDRAMLTMAGMYPSDGCVGGARVAHPQWVWTISESGDAFSSLQLRLLVQSNANFPVPWLTGRCFSLSSSFQRRLPFCSNSDLAI